MVRYCEEYSSLVLALCFAHGLVGKPVPIFPGRALSEIDGKIAGVVEPRALAWPDIDRRFRMLDHGRAAGAKSGRHVQPLEDGGLGPGERRRLENAAAFRFWRERCARLADGGFARAAHSNHAERGEL